MTDDEPTGATAAYLLVVTASAFVGSLLGAALAWLVLRWAGL